jgi:23S rRNA (uracil1939-C5)-methyltransferase
MLARHEGQIVLVAGAIPGERVTVRVTKAGKQVAFADVIEVLEASADRRESTSDPACGGCLYAHIDYPRQVHLKGEIIRDAFVRIGRIPMEHDVTVTAGAARGYRMRARFHVRNGRAGFYRENTHETCDPRQTGQLSEDAVDAVDAAIGGLAAEGITALSVELSENIGADQRALHVEAATSAALGRAVARAVDEAGLTGATISAADGTAASAGDPIVTDTLSALTDGRAQTGVLRRHPQAFFQGNRFLISALVDAVLDATAPGPAVDLYAGVGLFSVALAACGHEEITAVEGNPVSAADLERNAAPFEDQVRVARCSVETFLQGRPATLPKTLIVDPPRTGISKAASESIARSQVPRIVYVSCDPPTMARDARRLLDAGYRLTVLHGFDLFPNTAHVEAFGVFDL